MDSSLAAIFTLSPNLQSTGHYPYIANIVRVVICIVVSSSITATLKVYELICNSQAVSWHSESNNASRHGPGMNSNADEHLLIRLMSYLGGFDQSYYLQRHTRYLSCMASFIPLW